LSLLSGQFLLQFNGESFLFSPGATEFTAAECTTAFESLRNVEDAVCTITSSTNNDVTYQVQLRKFPVIPYETNIFSNDGNPPLSAFSCNTEQIVKAHDGDSIDCSIGETDTDKDYPGNFLQDVSSRGAGADVPR
jgi:hypothetical protein